MTDERKPVAPSDPMALALLQTIWDAAWTYDDYSEVCISIEARNALGAFLVARGVIPADHFEPLPVAGNEGGA